MGTEFEEVFSCEAMYLSTVCLTAPWYPRDGEKKHVN